MKKLHTSTIIFIGIAVIFLIFLIYLLYVSLTITKPHVGTCDRLKNQKNALLWNDDCSSIQEKNLDTNIPKPTESLYLSRFTSSESLGPPLATHVWYRYKYVNGKTGSYGQFSPWTKSPIIAGGKDLPCKDDCSNIDYDKCESNLVQVSIDSLDAKVENNMYANVYRYISKTANQPTDNTKNDELIGMLIPDGHKGGKFIDINSPCKKSSCRNPCHS